MFLLYLLVILIGVLPVVLLVYRIWQYRQLKTRGGQAMAEVRYINGYTYRKTNTIQVYFTVPETGQQIPKTQMVGGVPYRPGQYVLVYYSKQNPNLFVIDQNKNWVQPLVFGVLVALFCMFAAYKIMKGLLTGDYE